MKSTVEEIRTRFDGEVERFSNLETGQVATVDATLAMRLVAAAAVAVTPQATHLLDVGCGAGNYSLKWIETRAAAARESGSNWSPQELHLTLVDLSRNMLDRAEERLRAAGVTRLQTIQSDIRELALAPGSVDTILASAVLHHLRTPAEWEQVFRSFYQALRPSGGLWIFDLIECTHPALQQLMWRDYGEFLVSINGPQYRDDVFAYIEREDTPRSLVEQLDLLKAVGFAEREVLHKHSCFAAFGAVK